MHPSLLDSHQQRAADPGLDVLLGLIRLVPLQDGGQGFQVPLEDVVDGNHPKVDPEVGREFLCVGKAPRRRVAAWHGHPEHPVRTDGATGHRRSHGRVDAAGQAQRHPLEPGLGQVVAQPELEGLDRLLLLAFGHRAQLPDQRLARDGRHVVHQQILGEIARPNHHPPARIHHQRVAVEDQLVVTAHLVDVHEKAPGLGGVSSNEVPTLSRLAQLEGARGDVEQDVGTPV
jgi:hypothetical protein